MRRVKKYFNVIIIILLFLSINNANAQTDKDKKEGGRHEDRWNKIEELKKMKMLEELNLPEDLSFKFYTRYINHRNQFKEIEKERGQMILSLEKMMQGNPKEAEMIKSVEEFEKIEQKFMDTRKSFYSDIRKILPIDKVVKYILFERNFQRELQNIMRDVQGKNPREKGK